MIKKITSIRKTKVEFCTFLDSMDGKGRIQLVSIGKAKIL